MLALCPLQRVNERGLQALVLLSRPHDRRRRVPHQIVGVCEQEEEGGSARQQDDCGDEDGEAEKESADLAAIPTATPFSTEDIQEAQADGENEGSDDSDRGAQNQQRPRPPLLDSHDYESAVGHTADADENRDDLRLPADGDSETVTGGDEQKPTASRGPSAVAVGICGQRGKGR